MFLDESKCLQILSLTVMGLVLHIPAPPLSLLIMKVILVQFGYINKIFTSNTLFSGMLLVSTPLFFYFSNLCKIYSHICIYLKLVLCFYFLLLKLVIYVQLALCFYFIYFYILIYVKLLLSFFIFVVYLK